MDNNPKKTISSYLGVWILIAGLVVIIVVIAVPNFIKARSTSAQNACINNLRQIDGAKDQWAIENRRVAGDLVTKEGVAAYIKGNQIPQCPAGGKYLLNRVGQNPTCTIGGPGHALPSP